MYLIVKSIFFLIFKDIAQKDLLLRRLLFFIQTINLQYSLSFD